MKIPIRWQLVLLIGLFIFGTLFSSIITIQHFISVDYKEKLQNNNAIMSESIARNISQYIYSAVIINDMTADKYSQIKDYPYAQKKQELININQQYPWLENVAFIDLHGVQIIRTNGIEGDRSYQDWFKEISSTPVPY